MARRSAMLSISWPPAPRPKARSWSGSKSGSRAAFFLKSKWARVVGPPLELETNGPKKGKGRYPNEEEVCTSRCRHFRHDARRHGNGAGVPARPKPSQQQADREEDGRQEEGPGQRQE